MDAELGGGIVKKRVARHGEGKRGGFRTIVAYRAGARAFFIHGFAKNAKANVGAKELTALKLLAKTYFALDDDALGQAVRSGALIEIGEV